MHCAEKDGCRIDVILQPNMSDTRMVVAQIIDSLDTGGAEVVAVNIANSLSKVEGATSHLIVTRHVGNLKDRINPAVKLFVLNKSGKFDFKALFRLRQYFIRENIEIVHAHSTSFLYPSILYPFFRFKLVWHDHYGLPIREDGDRNYPYRLFSPMFDFVFCVSQRLVESNQKHLKVSDDRIRLLYNFSVKMPVLPSQKIAKPLQKKVLVLSANLRPQKDHRNLIAAIGIVTKVLPNIIVYCIGGSSDNEYKKSLEAEVENLELQDVILFEGPQQNPYAYFEIADLALLTSSSEGLPLTLIEYGLAGCAVVCTDVGQSSAVVNNENGWLVPAGNSAELAKAILFALTNPDVAFTKASRLREDISRFFSEEAAIANILKVYNDIS